MEVRAMSEFEDLTKLIKDFINKRDWQQFHNPKDLAISLSLEASELLEHFQWKSEAEITQHIHDHRVELGEELSDILYWVLLIASNLDIDLERAFKHKMEQNASKYPISKSKGKHLKYDQL
jgi:dCTP diphosphatase